MPTVPTLPGDKRWKAMQEQGRALLETMAEEMQTYFEGRSEKWQEGEKGDIDGMGMTLLLDQTNKLADGSVTITANATVRGTFKKAAVSEESIIKLHIRATGSDPTKSFSLTLEGKREGNTIKGNGTLVVRGPLNVPIETRNVTWVAHFAGVR